MAGAGTTGEGPRTRRGAANGAAGAQPPLARSYGFRETGRPVIPARRGSGRMRGAKARDDDQGRAAAAWTFLTDEQQAAIAWADPAESSLALARRLGRHRETVATFRRRVAELGGWGCPLRWSTCEACGRPLASPLTPTAASIPPARSSAPRFGSAPGPGSEPAVGGRHGRPNSAPPPSPLPKRGPSAPTKRPGLGPNATACPGPKTTTPSCSSARTRRWRRPRWRSAGRCTPCATDGRCCASAAYCRRRETIKAYKEGERPAPSLHLPAWVRCAPLVIQQRVRLPEQADDGSFRNANGNCQGRRSADCDDVRNPDDHARWKLKRPASPSRRTQRNFWCMYWLHGPPYSSGR